MATREFHYKYFIKRVNQLLSDYIVQLHYAYEKRNDWAILIIKNSDIYKKAGIDINPVYDSNNTMKIFYTNKHSSKINRLYISYINSYNYLIYCKIPQLDEKIEALASRRGCYKFLYTTIQREINFYIGKHLLKGNNYSFGSRLGYIYIYILCLKGTSTFRPIDKKATLEMIKLYKENGITVKDKDNPDGKSPIVRLPYDDIPKCVFRPGVKKCENASFYKFHLNYTYTYINVPGQRSNYINQKPVNLNNRTFKELVDDRKISIYNKLLAISIHLGDLKYNIYHNNKTNTTKQEITEYHEQSNIY